MQEKVYRKVYGRYIQFVSYPSMLPIHLLSQFSVMSAGTGKGRVPWTELQRDQDEYIKLEYLPENITLKQFHHLCQKDVNAILGHWAQRKADGKVPFRFRKAAKAMQKDKHTSEGSDANADMGPGKGADWDQQGNDGSQAQGNGPL